MCFRRLLRLFDVGNIARCEDAWMTRKLEVLVHADSAVRREDVFVERLQEARVGTRSVGLDLLQVGESCLKRA